MFVVVALLTINSRPVWFACECLWLLPATACSHGCTFVSPRQGELSDDVRLRGEPKLVQKIKAELEVAVAALRDRIVLGVDVPAVQHRALIGRGGQNLNELQNKYSVMVQFPGSRSYSQAGEPENAAEMASADPANVVRVSGRKAAVEKAIDELKVGHLRWPA